MKFPGWMKCLQGHEQIALLWLAFKANRKGEIPDFRTFDLAEDCGICAVEADSALEMLDQRGILVFSKSGRWAVLEPWTLDDLV